MEQKKTLWIIAAVGAFLLVVIGGAAIMYSPAKTQTPAIASVSPVEKHKPGMDNKGWINPPVNEGNPNPISFPQNTKTNDLVVLADNATVYEVSKAETSGTTIDLNSLKKELTAEPQPQNINITVNIPDNSKAPVVTKTPVYETVTKVEPKKETKVEPKANVKPVAAKAAPKPAAAPAAKAEPKKTQYWVQVAAYSNKKGAEGARAALDSNKIPSDIFTFKDNKDRLFYRVRVGPYTTKSEAEYWRTRIIKIDDFAKAESYVTSTTN